MANPFENISCQTSFRISQERYRFNMERLFEKYSNLNDGDESDIIDITTMQITEPRGHNSYVGLEFGAAAGLCTLYPPEEPKKKKTKKRAREDYENEGRFPDFDTIEFDIRSRSGSVKCVKGRHSDVEKCLSKSGILLNKDVESIDSRTQKERMNDDFNDTTSLQSGFVVPSTAVRPPPKKAARRVPLTTLKFSEFLSHTGSTLSTCSDHDWNRKTRVFQNLDDNVSLVSGFNEQVPLKSKPSRHIQLTPVAPPTKKARCDVNEWVNGKQPFIPASTAKMAPTAVFKRHSRNRAQIIVQPEDLNLNLNHGEFVNFRLRCAPNTISQYIEQRGFTKDELLTRLLNCDVKQTEILKLDFAQFSQPDGDIENDDVMSIRSGFGRIDDAIACQNVINKRKRKRRSNEMSKLFDSLHGFDENCTGLRSGSGQSELDWPINGTIKRKKGSNEVSKLLDYGFNTKCMGLRSSTSQSHLNTPINGRPKENCKTREIQQQKAPGQKLASKRGRKPLNTSMEKKIQNVGTAGQKCAKLNVKDTQTPLDTSSKTAGQKLTKRNVKLPATPLMTSPAAYKIESKRTAGQKFTKQNCKSARMPTPPAKKFSRHDFDVFEIDADSTVATLGSESSHSHSRRISPKFDKSPIPTRQSKRCLVQNWLNQTANITKSGAFEEDQSVKSLDRGLRQIRATCRRQTDLNKMGFK